MVSRSTLRGLHGRAPWSIGRVLARASGVLDRDPLDDVGDVLGLVDRRLEELIDLFPLDDLERLVALVEEPRDRGPGHLVTLVLEAVDLDPARLEVLEAAKVEERLVELLAGL